MNGDGGSKINKLMKAWPQGTVAVSSWLEAQGIYHQLASGYERHSWIQRIGHGAYIRDGDQVGWQGALYAIQQHLRSPIHVAAKTALEYQGILHFVRSNPAKEVFLFGANKSKLPTWFKTNNWKASIHFTATQLFSGVEDLGLIEKSIGAYSIQISTRERAALELLHLVPQFQDFEEAHLLFESLRTLRPELVQKLLEKCRSIKAKRLFLYFAESTNQEWFKELKLKRIKLGSGKRVISKGGHFNSKYNISVPKLANGVANEELEGA